MKENNSQLIKELNEIRILNLIRAHAPISRIELAKKTNISKVAISEIVNRLDKAGFILEVGKGRSTRKGGKRPTLIKLNPENGYVFGIEFKRNKVRLALSNLESKIITHEQINFDIGISIPKVLEKITQKIDHILKQQNIDADKLISIGIGIPGFVDYEKGELAFADTMQGWGHKPLAAPLSERYKVPVVLENDVNTIAMGEYLIGAGKDEQNLVCIWIGDGIGAGIILDGRLIRGDSGSAGEIGYLELGNALTNKSLLKNMYTNQHNFGDILSERYLYEILQTKLKWHATQTDHEPEKLGLEDILKLGDEGNTVVQEILDEYALLLAVVCTELIKTINTSLIILCGRTIENSAYLLHKVKQIINTSTHKIPFTAKSIKIGELKREACVKGAIAMALQVIFEPRLSKRDLKHTVVS